MGIPSAFVMTTTVVCSLIAFAMLTKKDFTFSNIIWWILIIDIGHLFFYMIFGRMEFVSVAFSLFSITAFCIYLVIDVQSLMSGKRRKMSIDDYIFASCIIYLDIIQIFLKILEMTQEKKDKKKD